MAEDERDGAETPSPATIPQESKRRWGKRLALSVAVLLLLLLLIITLLPTIITSGPIRRHALARINQALPAGEVTLDGLAFGWLTPFRLEGLQIRDADGARILVLESIRMNRSIWGVLTHGDRFGTVEVGGFHLSVVRRADGSFAFSDLMPPTESEADPDAAPFELRLSKLLPAIQVPTSALNVQLGDWKVIYTDEAAAVRSEISMGELGLRWTGNSSPLRLTASGNWELPQIEGEWSADMTLENWIRDRAITWESMRLDGSVRIGNEEATAREINIAAALGRESLQATIGLDLALAETFRPLMPHAPELSGKLTVGATLDSSGDASLATVSLSMSGLAVHALPEWSLEVPRLQIDATAQLDPYKLEPGELTLLLDTPWVQGHIVELPTGRDRTLSSELKWRYADWVKGVEGELAGMLPQSDLAGTISLLGIRNAEQLGPYQFSATTTGSEITLPEALTSENLLLKDDLISLNGLIPDLFAELTQTGENLNLALSIKTDIYQSSLNLVQTEQNHASVVLTLMANIESLMEIVQRETTLGIPAGIFGVLEIDQTIAMEGSALNLSGSLKVDELRLESELIPGGSHSDGIQLQHTARIDAATGQAIDLTATLRTIFLDSEVQLSLRETLVEKATIGYRIRLGDLMESAAAVLIPPELGLLVEGDLLGEVTLSGDPSTALNVAAGLETADEFQLLLESPNVAIENLRTNLAATVEFTPVGFSLSDIAWSAALGEEVTLQLSGSIQQQGDHVSGALAAETLVDFSALLPRLVPIVEEYAGAEILMEGTHNSRTEIQFSIQTGDQVKLTEPLRLQLTSILQLASVEALLPDDSFVELADLTDSRTLTLTVTDLTSAVPAWKEEGAFSLGTFGWSGGVTGGGFRAQSAGEGDPANGHRYGFRSVALEFARFESDTMTGEFPPLDAELSVEADGELNAVALKTLWSLGEAARFSLEGSARSRLIKSELWNETARVATSLNLDLGQLIRIDQGNSLSGRTDGLDGRMDLSLAAEATNIGPRHGWSVPTITDWQARFQFKAENITLATQLAELVGANARVELDAANNDWRVELDLMPAVAALGGEPTPHLEGARTRVVGTLDSGGELNLIDAFIDLPRAETLLGLRGVVRGIREAASSAEGFSPAGALDLPAQLFLEFRQGLAGLGLYSPLSDGSGELMVNATLDNIPGQQITFGARLQANRASLGYADFLRIEGLDGALPYSKRLFHRRGLTDFRRPVSSSLNLVSASYQIPPYSAAIRALQTTVTAGNTAFGARILSGDFLGGQIDARMALKRTDRDPSVEASFAVTGFDGASVLPNLRRVRRDRRSFDAFGFAQMRFREDSTISGLMDDIVLRMDLTNFSREFLREAIRFIDPEGASPGIQAMNGALAYASPSGGHVEIRSGLINADVRMVTAASVEFPMPLFDRTSLASALEPYVQPAWNELLPFARQLMAMLLAEDVADLKAYINPGVTP